MDVSRHLESLRADGERMVKAIEAVPADAPIPTCPEWTMRDLVLHQGEVHRWARTIVAGRRTTPPDDDFLGPLPDDAGLVEWFRDGVESLAATLSSADPGAECWTFMKAASPVAFWARRQCHETGIHRADAESASGVITPFPPDVAADGIDELLTGFVPRPRTPLRSDEPRTLAVRTIDTGDAWLVRISGDPVQTERVGADADNDADCTVSSLASDLHLFLWNRLHRDAVDVSGDAAVLDLWRGSVTIRWS